MLSLLLALPALAAEPLTVSVREGGAPLTVRITGPAAVLAKAKECKSGTHGWNGPGGNGLSVAWGDGSPVPGASGTGSCEAEQTSHVFSVPGSYQVNVRLWHPGPTDAPITDWAGSADVKVTGTETGAEFELLSPKGGEQLTYQQIPRPKWRLKTGRKVDLKIELRTAQGKVVAEGGEKGFAYSGEGETYLRPLNGNYEALDEALREGEASLSLRATLSAEGKTLLETASRPFTMTAEFKNVNGGLALRPPEGSDPLHVKIGYHVWHSDCFSYRLDWGDGTAPEEKTLPTKSRCELKGEDRIFEHRYAKPGTYRVKLKSSNIDSFKPLDKITMYEALSLDLKPLPPGVRTVQEAHAIEGLASKGCHLEGLELPKGTRVLAAGAYGGRPTPRQIDQSGHYATTIDATVNVPGPVALVLGAYEPTVWTVRWTQPTKIVAVVVGGYHRQGVAGLPTSTPRLVSTIEGGKCGYFYVAPDQMNRINEVSRSVFGTGVETAYAANDGVVTVGDPVTGTTLTSADVKPDSFYDANAPLAGHAGLADAVKKGILRAVTEADLAELNRALDEHERKEKGSSGADTKLVGFAGGSERRVSLLGPLGSYVVLREFTYPAGLYGGNSAAFLVPKGVPSPKGNPGHSDVYDLNLDPPCRGPGCGRR